MDQRAGLVTLPISRNQGVTRRQNGQVQNRIPRSFGSYRGDLHRSPLTPEVATSRAALCDSLRTAVAEAALRDAEPMEELSVAVSSFTIALKDEGLTPEAVLIVIKTVINNRSLLVIRPRLSDWTGEALRETISTWCIRDSFRERIV